MPQFENINSPSPAMSLEKEIQLAVAQSIEPLLCTGNWRMYTGPHQEQLTDQLRELLATSHVGLTCSGSAALELLLKGQRYQAGDEVLLSAYDYPGNFTAIETSGAKPVLVDIEPDGWNLSLDSLSAAWTPACKALIVSHLHGQLQDLPNLLPWCRQRNVLLIQDACQALGASINQEPLGTWSDATVISFGGSKVISAGRGGAWYTQNADLAQHVRLASGIGSGTYEMSELQAAVVAAQLPFLTRISNQCRSFFSRLIDQVPAITPWSNQLDQTAFYQAGWIRPADDDPNFDAQNFANSIQNAIRRLTNEASRETNTSSLDPNKDRDAFRIGRGFDGFHRRSTRRCRKAGNLENAAKISERTFTIHHRVAIS